MLLPHPAARKTHDRVADIRSVSGRFPSPHRLTSIYSNFGAMPPRFSERRPPRDKRSSLPLCKPNRRLHSQLRRIPILLSSSEALSALFVPFSEERKRERERGKLELTNSHHAGYREAGRCPALAMRRTTCIVRQSSRRHVPVIAYSACNITKHHRGRTCKQHASPPTRGRHLSALSQRN